MALIERLIDVTFTLASGTFSESGTNTVTFSGLRTSARISNAGGAQVSILDLQIFGLTLSIMNELSTLGMIVRQVPNNIISVNAGDSSGKSLIFTGNVFRAWADFQAMPEVPFRVMAQAGGFQSVQNIQPTSFTGATSVVTIMETLATQMGLSLQNNGVTAILASPYFSGSALTQARACAKAGRFQMLIENQTLFIWPTSGSRNGAIPLISPQTGLVGYPSYSSWGLAFKTLFNPNIGFGGQVQVQSSLTPASQTWIVYMLNHELDSMVPDGNWFSNVEVYNPKYPPPEGPK